MGDVYVFPLSFAQERLWFLDRLVPGNPFYIVDVAMRLHGPLDVAALEEALNEVVRRHETLRTTFPIVDGQPVQVVAPELRLSLGVVDLDGVAEAERDAHAMARATAEAHCPFDLAAGPLLRGLVVRMDGDHALLSLTTHHIVCDGWSMGVLLGELEILYGAFSAGRPSPLPELPIQYADFTVWQREWLQGRVLQEQLTYWRRQLAALPELMLPGDRPRPAVPSFRGGSHSLRLGPGLSPAAKTMAQREGVTLFMLLLAVFHVLLARWSGQDDIVTGLPIANRQRPELEGLIGFFVNTLVLRVDLGGDPSFREILRRVREVTLEAYAHQDIPFEKLVDELQPGRQLGRNPLFQVTFQLQNTGGGNGAGEKFSGLTSAFVTTPGTTAKFDLAFDMWDGADGLGGRLEYNSDVFDADTVARLATRYEVLLAGSIADPERSISELPLMTSVERERMLRAGHTPTRVPDGCVHERFEAQVRRTPEALAIRFRDETLTYRELNGRANRLAHHLRSIGVRPATTVGVCLDHRPSLLVAILAILKAGGAYLPLDPSFPATRLRFLMQDSSTGLVVSDEGLAGSLPLPAGARCCRVDAPELAAEPDDDPVSGAEPTHLAYVIYTSGSTGQPKGVLIEHRSLLNYLTWINEGLWDGRPLTMPVVSRFSFDACLKQLLAPLVRGGEVWLLEPSVLASPQRLWDEISSRDAVALNCVPTLWRAMLDVLESGGTARPPKALRALLLSGDRVSDALVERTFRRFPDLECWNIYGPTEVTANATAGRLIPGEPVTIGRPIANTHAYVLDRHGEPVPIGVAGELHIGGAGVARGYLNRPGLSEAKFIADLCGPGPRGRMFRTGDLVRWRSDGRLVFIGRLDGLIKVRGFRIEPAEIEAALGEHAAVRHSVVVSVGTEDEDPQLVAYIVWDADSPPPSDEIRAFLRHRLPDYLVPARFVGMTELPLTSSGKVDRAALPPLDRERPRMGTRYAAARTRLERTIVEVWQEVLRLDAVGVHDNFFDVGGRSLLLVQVHGRLRERLRRDLSIMDLFRYPTPRALAGLLDGAPEEHA